MLTAAGIKILASPPQSPKANAICERCIGTLRRELPGWLLVVNERHLHKVLTEYLRHYNTARPRRSPGQLTPAQAGTRLPEQVNLAETGSKGSRSSAGSLTSITSPPYLHPSVTASVRCGVDAVAVVVVRACLSLLPVPDSCRVLRAVFGKTQAVHEPAGLNRTARLAGRTVPRQVRVQDRPREEWTGIPVPALVDEDTFDRVQQRLEDNKRFAARNTKVPSLLQGLAACSSCGYYC